MILKVFAASPFYRSTKLFGRQSFSLPVRQLIFFYAFLLPFKYF
ncbi:hypothetical protein CLOLEP_00411 [[Clostridium] leptum DSM 753]|uniref:Uncharacterized protein n=1 Tax=[Clostridium] leptum DSM 753 TaxID=428125 RepID=A7VPD5_9FIRM|nr:hypothetical protein CLOLEP_00411 [[Clostridium] leptum DSM 753]